MNDQNQRNPIGDVVVANGHGEDETALPRGIVAVLAAAYILDRAHDFHAWLNEQGMATTARRLAAGDEPGIAAWLSQQNKELYGLRGIARPGFLPKPCESVDADMIAHRIGTNAQVIG